MVADDRDLPRPGLIGRLFTDMFNDWGPGGRAAATLVRGPDPADVPYGKGAETPPATATATATAAAAGDHVAAGGATTGPA
jgi:hypothetical protein